MASRFDDLLSEFDSAGAPQPVESQSGAPSKFDTVIQQFEAGRTRKPSKFDSLLKVFEEEEPTTFKTAEGAEVMTPKAWREQEAERLKKSLPARALETTVEGVKAIPQSVLKPLALGAVKVVEAPIGQAGEMLEKLTGLNLGVGAAENWLYGKRLGWDERMLKPAGSTAEGVMMNAEMARDIGARLYDWARETVPYFRGDNEAIKDIEYERYVASAVKAHDREKGKSLMGDVAQVFGVSDENRHWVDDYTDQDMAFVAMIATDPIFAETALGRQVYKALAKGNKALAIRLAKTAELGGARGAAAKVLLTPLDKASRQMARLTEATEKAKEAEQTYEMLRASRGGELARGVGSEKVRGLIEEARIGHEAAQKALKEAEEAVKATERARFEAPAAQKGFVGGVKDLGRRALESPSATVLEAPARLLRGKTGKIVEEYGGKIGDAIRSHPFVAAGTAVGLEEWWRTGDPADAVWKGVSAGVLPRLGFWTLRHGMGVELAQAKLERAASMMDSIRRGAESLEAGGKAIRSGIGRKKALAKIADEVKSPELEAGLRQMATGIGEAKRGEKALAQAANWSAMIGENVDRSIRAGTIGWGLGYMMSGDAQQAMDFALMGMVLSPLHHRIGKEIEKRKMIDIEGEDAFKAWFKKEKGREPTEREVNNARTYGLPKVSAQTVREADNVIKFYIERLRSRGENVEADRILNAAMFSNAPRKVWLARAINGKESTRGMGTFELLSDAEYRAAYDKYMKDSGKEVEFIDRFTKDFTERNGRRPTAEEVESARIMMREAAYRSYGFTIPKKEGEPPEIYINLDNRLASSAAWHEANHFFENVKIYADMKRRTKNLPPEEKAAAERAVSELLGAGMVIHDQALSKRYSWDEMYNLYLQKQDAEGMRAVSKEKFMENSDEGQAARDSILSELKATEAEEFNRRALQNSGLGGELEYAKMILNSSDDKVQKIINKSGERNSNYRGKDGRNLQNSVESERAVATQVLARASAMGKKVFSRGNRPQKIYTPLDKIVEVQELMQQKREASIRGDQTAIDQANERLRIMADSGMYVTRPKSEGQMQAEAKDRARRILNVAGEKREPTPEEIAASRKEIPDQEIIAKNGRPMKDEKDTPAMSTPAQRKKRDAAIFDNIHAALLSIKNPVTNESDGLVVRRSADGQVYWSGKFLNDEQLAAIEAVSHEYVPEAVKRNIRVMNDLAKVGDGSPIQMSYFEVGGEKKGNTPVIRRTVSPTSIQISKAGNVRMTTIDQTVYLDAVNNPENERFIRVFEQPGDRSVADSRKRFRDATLIYLDNHANNLPGATQLTERLGMGTNPAMSKVMADAINGFFGIVDKGVNSAWESDNNFWRAYRFDRMYNIQNSKNPKMPIGRQADGRPWQSINFMAAAEGRTEGRPADYISPREEYMDSLARQRGFRDFEDVQMRDREVANRIWVEGETAFYSPELRAKEEPQFMAAERELPLEGDRGMVPAEDERQVPVHGRVPGATPEGAPADPFAYLGTRPSPRRPTDAAHSRAELRWLAERARDAETGLTHSESLVRWAAAWAEKNGEKVPEAVYSDPAAQAKFVGEVYKKIADTFFPQAEKYRTERSEKQKAYVEKRAKEEGVDLTKLDDATFAKWDQYAEEFDKIMPKVIEGAPQFMAAEKTPEALEARKEWREKGEESKFFKAWTKGLPVIGSKGEIPSKGGVIVRGKHGTTHGFWEFDRSKINAENDFGKGFYFTNSDPDVAANYSRQGPDLTNRIERFAEEIQQSGELTYEEAIAEAKKQLVGKKEGRVIDAYVKMENPLIVGDKGETYFETVYDEATGRESGNGPDLANALRIIAAKYDETKPGELYQNVVEATMDGIGAEELIARLKKDESLAYATDEFGNMMASEIIRQAFEDLGYDGIIDRSVNRKFGSERFYKDAYGNKIPGKAMEGMDPDTVHFIAFKPENVKLATGREVSGQFGPGADIRFMSAPEVAEHQLASVRPLETPKEDYLPEDMRFMAAISPGKAKSLGIENSTADQYLVARFPDMFKGVSNSKQYSERVWQEYASLISEVKGTSKYLTQSIDIERFKRQIREGQQGGVGDPQLAQAIRTLRNADDRQIVDYANQQKMRLNQLQRQALDKIAETFSPEVADYSDAEKYLIMQSIVSEYAMRDQNGNVRIVKLGPKSEQIPAVPTMETIHGALDRIRNPGQNKRVSELLLEASEEIEKARQGNRVIVPAEDAKGNKGKWIMFPSEKNDPKNFEANAEDLNTLAKTSGIWCTGQSLGTAQTQLRGGDFWVFTINGKARVAIRMRGSDQIGELRGVMKGQGLEPEMAEAAMKLVEDRKISGGEDYVKEAKFKSEIMEIEDRLNKGELDDRQAVSAVVDAAEKNGYEAKTTKGTWERNNLLGYILSDKGVKVTEGKLEIPSKVDYEGAGVLEGFDRLQDAAEKTQSQGRYDFPQHEADYAIIRPVDLSGTPIPETFQVKRLQVGADANLGAIGEVGSLEVSGEGQIKVDAPNLVSVGLIYPGRSAKITAPKLKKFSMIRVGGDVTIWGDRRLSASSQNLGQAAIDMGIYGPQPEHRQKLRSGKKKLTIRKSVDPIDSIQDHVHAVTKRMRRHAIEVVKIDEEGGAKVAVATNGRQMVVLPYSGEAPAGNVLVKIDNKTAGRVQLARQIKEIREALDTAESNPGYMSAEQKATYQANLARYEGIMARKYTSATEAEWGYTFPTWRTIFESDNIEKLSDRKNWIDITPEIAEQANAQSSINKMLFGPAEDYGNPRIVTKPDALSDSRFDPVRLTNIIKTFYENGIRDLEMSTALKDHEPLFIRSKSQPNARAALMPMRQDISYPHFSLPDRSLTASEKSAVEQVLNNLDIPNKPSLQFMADSMSDGRLYSEIPEEHRDFMIGNTVRITTNSYRDNRYMRDAGTTLAEMPIQFMAMKEEGWKTDQTQAIFGSVNNRLSKELEIAEALLGPIAESLDLPTIYDAKMNQVQKRSIRAPDLGAAIFRAHTEGIWMKILDPKTDLRKMAAERGLDKKKITEKDGKFKTEADKFVFFAEELRKGPTLYDLDDYGAPVLGENGKAGRAVDVLLALCHPTSPCAECYAAKSMIRMSTVFKAFRNTVHLLSDPIKFAEAIAKETNRIPITETPFLRLHGSGDLVTDEQIIAYNHLATKIDRPIHIFSRHHDMLEKLKGTQDAPFIKMGSIDADLYHVYGEEYLAENFKKRGIVNAFLYTDPSQKEIIRKLMDRDAIGLILSASKELHDTLKDVPRSIMSSCPCDAAERSYMSSCKQCALSSLGCFMSFANLGADTAGNLWVMGKDGSPENLKPVSGRLKSVKYVESMGGVASDIIQKSIQLVQLNIRKFNAGEAKSIPLKDIRFPDDVTYVSDVKSAEAYIGNLRLLKDAAESGTFFLPGGEIQPPVYFSGGERAVGETAKRVKVLSQVSLSTEAKKLATSLADISVVTEQKKPAPKGKKALSN